MKKRDFFEQQMANELEMAKRRKEEQPAVPPPPPPPASSSKKKTTKVKKTIVKEKREKDAERITLPANNSAQATPPNQGAGTSLPGPKQAVMPVTSSQPATVAPCD